jgi:hypothetical protein
MSAKIRTFLLVTLVTVLIWLWAEGESLSSDTLTTNVVFVEDNDLQIEPDRQWSGALTVRLQGSIRALTDARRELGTQIRLQLGQPGMPSTPQEEQQPVNMEEAIRQLPAIRSLGLSVQGVTPGITLVKIVKLVNRDLPVRVVLPRDIGLLGDSTVSPAKITVRIPEALAGRLSDDAFAEAPLSRAELDASRDDTAQVITAAVRIPALEGVERQVVMIPDRVSVTFRLKRSVDTVTIPSVPVWYSLPPTEGKRWDIELTDQFLRDVTFTGPTESIAKIRSREVIPIAQVQITSDELENAIEAKEAVFVGLPPGVESGVAVKTVRLRIQRRRNDVDQGPPALNVPASGDVGDGERE